MCAACRDILSYSTRHPWRASYFLLRGQEKVSTAPQERREQQSWPVRRRAGARSQEKATPSLCCRCTGLLRGCLRVHPWTGSQLAHVLWAIRPTDPAQSRRERRYPNSAHRARQSQSPSSALSGTFSRKREKEKEPYRENAPLLLLRLGCAGSAVNGAPEQWRRCVGKARRVARMDASQFVASTRMCCQQTPGAALRSRRAGCPETTDVGWPSLWLPFSWPRK